MPVRTKPVCPAHMRPAHMREHKALVLFEAKPFNQLAGRATKCCGRPVVESRLNVRATANTASTRRADWAYQSGQVEGITTGCLLMAPAILVGFL